MENSPTFMVNVLLPEKTKMANHKITWKHGCARDAAPAACDTRVSHVWDAHF
jgi:hypothetical protein